MLIRNPFGNNALKVIYPNIEGFKNIIAKEPSKNTLIKQMFN